MANDASNVGVGKPKVTGAISIAPLTAKAPTDAVSELPGEYKGIGYCNDEGVQVEEERDSEDVVAWGGVTVLTTQTSYKETASFTPIEINPEVAKMEYGEDNVEVSEGKMTIKHTAAVLPEKRLVVETVLNSKTIARYFVPRAQLTEKGTLALDDSNPIGRSCTFNCLPDEDGVTMYEYLTITGLTAAAYATVLSAIDGKTVRELEAYAEENGIDLSGSKTKADKIAAIAKAVSDE